MLANVLYFAYVVFLTLFVAVVLIGHVLLLEAMLPDLLPQRRAPRPHDDTPAGDEPLISPPVLRSDKITA